MMTFSTMGNSEREITKAQKHETGNSCFEHEHAKVAETKQDLPASFALLMYRNVFF